jgi:tetratricopeptide (TPR) repeat protein
MPLSFCFPWVITNTSSSITIIEKRRRRCCKNSTKMSTLAMNKSSFITAVVAVSILLSSILTSTTKRVTIVSAFTIHPTILSLPTSTGTNEKNDNKISRRRRRRLYASSGGGGDGDGNNKDNNGMSASNRERREEDKRRNARKEDVIIGKTSAKRGEKDYVIDPKATEIEYLRSVSRTEQLIYQYTQDGMDEMNLLKLDDANKSFDKVFELKPEAYLWQAGIVKFYLKDYFGAADIFARNAIQYEAKFSRPMGIDPASEERIWRNASELKYMDGLKRSERKEYLLEKEKMTPSEAAAATSIIPQIQEKEEQEDDDEDVMVETRKVLKLTNELFVATVEQKVDVEVVARAQLLSIVAGDEKLSSQPNAQRLILDRKKRKLNAWYYLGLHYDVTGNKAESKRCIKMAFKLAGLNAGKSSDIMATLPLLHMSARDWFDDDPYCDDDDENDGFDDYVDFDPTGTTTTDSVIEEESDDSQDHLSDAYSDPVVEKSIMSSVEKMKFPQIKDALLIRGLSVTGSKQLLKERLFISLMDDAGFQSGFAP